MSKLVVGCATDVVLVRANNPEELASKIARAERGLFEDEEESRDRGGTEETKK